LEVTVKIIVVRHGQTEWNKKDIFRGRKDIPLDESGKKQAMLTAGRIAEMGLSVKAVYASPLHRAVETAQQIARIYGLKVIPKNELIEFDCGEWEGHCVEEVKKKYPQIYTDWLNHPEKLVIPGAESLEQVTKRVQVAVKSILKEAQGDTVIVTHKVINKVVIGCLMGWDQDHFWKLEQDLAAINIIEIQDRHAVVEMLNHTTHLLHDK
jgi:broad specificity phosphatase PhoE